MFTNMMGFMMMPETAQHSRFLKTEHEATCARETSDALDRPPSCRHIESDHPNGLLACTSISFPDTLRPSTFAFAFAFTFKHIYSTFQAAAHQAPLAPQIR